MGQIPHAFIEELLSRIDIVQVVSEQVPLKRAGANYVANCPFHQEKTPSFTVSPSKQFYHCFGCGVSGDAIRFLTDYEGLHFTEAVEELANRAGLPMPEDTGSKEPSYNPIYDILAKAKVFYQNQMKEHPAARSAHTYLKNRGMEGKTAKHFHLGYASADWDGLLKALGVTKEQIDCLMAAGLIIKKGSNYYDRFRNRILFPIHDRRGRVIGFGGRTLDPNGKPKYLNSPETAVFHKSRELYGLFEARLGERALHTLIVVEGYMDVVSLHQAGIKNAVATLGTALTDKHVEVLFTVANEIIFCFDGDDAGQQAAKKTLHQVLPFMKEGRRARFMTLPDKVDPDLFVRERGKPAFLTLVDESLTLSDCLLKQLTDGLDLSVLENRAQLVSKGSALIKKLPKGVYQDLLLKRLAEIAKVEPTFMTPKASYTPKTRSAPKYIQTPLPDLAMRAMTMLLKDKGLFQWIGDYSSWENLQLPSVKCFCALIDILKIDPNIASDRMDGLIKSELANNNLLEQFKSVERFIPTEGIEEEFKGAIQRLNEAAKEGAVDILLSKARLGNISVEEKALLKDLLSQKLKDQVD